MAGEIYGNMGEPFGVADYAYFDKMFLKNVVQNTKYDRMATIRKELPQKNSNKIEVRRWIELKYLMLGGGVNSEMTGINPEVTGEDLLLSLPEGAYNDYVLAEGSSGNQAPNMKRIKKEAEVFFMGTWNTYTEEVGLFDSKWTVQEELRQHSEVASLLIDAYYRDVMSNGAGIVYDLSDNNVGDPEFTQANKRVGNTLYLTGSKSTGHMISASLKYGTVPVYLDYVADAHPNLIQAIADSNPDWVPVEKYAPNQADRLEDEIGKIGNIRYRRNPNALVEKGDEDGEYIGTILIYGRDHTAQIPVRGKKRLQTIVNPLGKDSKDHLRRVGSLGWKALLGAMVVYPERLAKIKIKFNY